MAELRRDERTQQCRQLSDECGARHDAVGTGCARGSDRCFVHVGHEADDWHVYARVFFQLRDGVDACTRVEVDEHETHVGVDSARDQVIGVFCDARLNAGRLCGAADFGCEDEVGAERENGGLCVLFWLVLQVVYQQCFAG
jgi:hypothetical protein